MPMPPTGYWMLVCNPRKWAFDKFALEHLPKSKTDAWGVRPSDAPGFAPGQLALIRVGNDARPNSLLEGRHRLVAGIYAVCEVTSKPFKSRGAGEDYWYSGSERAVDNPTVSLRYLKTFLNSPLTIEELRKLRSDFNPHILNGLQTSSFPIAESDFFYILQNLEGAEQAVEGMHASPMITWSALAELERKLLGAPPLVKDKISKRFERGQVGEQVKRANGYKCQICEKLGLGPLGFLKKDGEHYVEAHHVVPISSQQIGAGAHRNVISVCANHHRQLHFGGVTVEFGNKAFRFHLPEKMVEVNRFNTG